MKATFKTPAKECKIAQNRKENHFSHQYSVIDADLNEVCTLRIYSTNAANYACFWLYGVNGTEYRSGGGKASGYGYHRPSAAAQAAFSQAGISLSEDIGGVGEGAMEKALLAIAEAATGRKKLAIIRAHA